MRAGRRDFATLLLGMLIIITASLVYLVYGMATHPGDVLVYASVLCVASVFSLGIVGVVEWTVEVCFRVQRRCRRRARRGRMVDANSDVVVLMDIPEIRGS